MALPRCKQAWQESEDAIVMIEADTCSFVPVYKGPTALGGAGDTRSVTPEQRTESLERRRGVGHVFPSAFKPPLPDSSPAELFPATRIGRSDSGETVRFVSGPGPRKILVYADGACTNNGQPNPRGGWAVVYSPVNAASGRLEDKGPFGHDSVATSNRAELRAAIAVLRLCDWRGEGFGTIVIATDSSYVADGATGWAKGWVRNGWKTRTGGDVKNKDLWELLLGEVEIWEDRGLHVALWKIPRELNADADIEAKEAAENGTAKAEFRDVVIGGFRTTTTTTNARTERNPRILALCLEHESLLDDVFGTSSRRLLPKPRWSEPRRPRLPSACSAKSPVRPLSSLLMEL